MKTKILALLVATAGFASAASLTVYSGTTSVNLESSGFNVAFSIPQFDPSFGTLTGVTVKVVESSLTGNFKVTNAGLTTLTVGPNTADFRVDDVSNNLGYAVQLIEIEPLLTAASTSPFDQISSGDFEVYTITPNQGYSVDDQNIDASKFAAYTGTGDVTFNVRNRINIAATGSSYTVDTANAYTSTKMAITYTYTPIPEPGSWLIVCGGLGAGLFVRRRRA
jgi:hypothetical protein